MTTNKHIQFWSILLVFLTIVGVGNAWGDSVTFDAETDCGDNATNGVSATPDAVTKGVITVTSSNGPMGNTANYRVYQDGTLTISSSATITNIVLTCTAQGNSSNGPQKLSGSGYTGSSGYTGEWSGSSTTVTLSASAQVRITEIVVTYTPAAPSTVTFNAQGGTFPYAAEFTRTTPSYQIDEASGGAGITLPHAAPSTSCASEGWAFYGWATAQCASSTTTAPAIVGKSGDTYYPASNTTLHAVYYQLTGGTSTATFNPSTLTGLTKLSSDTKRPAQYVHDASNIELYIKDYGIFSSTWDIDNTINAGNGWGYIKSPCKIQSVAITVSSGYAVDHIAESDAGSAALSTSGTSQTITCTGEVYTIYLYAANNSESKMTTFTVTYYPANYWSNPSCCDKEVAVSYNSAGSTHVSAMTFSAASTATCGGASTRRVTVFVTPTSGYLFKAGDELTWTKSSGTIPADPTLVSGPTLNAGKYEFVYEFAQNDNGAGTFAAAASTLTNYRTVCCTELGSIGGSVAFTNPTTAVVSWSDLDHVSSWTVKYKTHAAGVWNTAGASSASAGTRSVTISSLTCNTDYDFQIIATPASGYCDASQTIENENSGTWTVTSTGVTNVTPATSFPTTTCDGFSIASMSPASGYHLPTSITVTNADHTWNSTTGALTISNVTGNVTITITGEENSCDAYSFHTGGSDVWNTRAENKCFVQDGSTKRWYISNYTITSNTHFCLNWQGGKYDRGGDNNVRFMTQPWTEMSLAYGRSGKVGVATGAVGTIQMYANSSDDNLYVGFIPDGYVLKYNGVNEVMTQSSTYVWYAPTPYTINSTTQGYTVAVGLNDGSDNYVTCDNTAAVKHIFVKVDHSDWTAAAAKYELYNIQTSSFVGEYMRAVPGETNLYEGWIPSGCTSIIIARCNPGAAIPTGNTWTNVWNQTQNITLDGSKNYYTINSKDGSSKYYGAWSVYEKSGKWYLDLDGTTTGGQKNFSCYFYPHYVLHYDANSGSGAPADQSVALDASPCQLTVSSTVPTRAGYTFLGWNQSSSATTPDGDWDGGDTHAMTADVTLYAVWAANHTLSYNYNGGDGSSCVGGTKYTGESFTACASAGSKTGYTFNNWLGSNSVSYTAGSSYSMPDADLTLTAQWNPDVYNITYKDQGDAAYSGNKTDGRPTGNPATHTYGSASALEDGVKAGYRFDGWYTNSTCTEGPVTSLGATAITAGITLYAKWTQIWTISWKIWNNSESRYDEYAGDGTHTTWVVAGGTISKIPTNPADNALSSCASKFMGWSETCLGSDVGQSAPGDLFTSTPGGSITENKTYYAVFASVNVAEKWVKTALGSITAGTYVLLDENDKAFNGTINGDKHGELTATAFSFVAGEATSAPEGTCEIEFKAVSGGFKMYNPTNERYLYATAASAGKLAWAVSDDDYWYLDNSNWTYSATYSSKHPIVRTYNNLMRSYAPSTTNGIALVVAKKTPGTWKDYVTSCCGTAAVTNGGFSNVTGSGTTMSAKVTWADAANTNRYRVVCTALSIDEITTNKYYTTAGVMTSCTDYTFNVYAAPSGGCQSAPLEITVSPVEAAKTVTFNYNGSGQSDGSFTTDCTHSSTNLPTPDAYAGHRFDGWYDDASSGSKIGNAGASYTPTATITLYAHWVAIADLTYSGDVTSTCTGTTSKDVGTTITACSPSSRDHYTFDYWVRSDNSAHVNAGATFTMPGSALTLTAHWTADSYSITYKDQGDVAYSGSNSASLPASHSYGTATVLVDGVKSGYRFDGWFTTSACTGEPITSLGATAYTSAITLYAKWTASYTFTFSKNGIVDDELTRGQIGGGNLVMPNTTVDCGLWTTFEGWVESDVAQTTTEPATIYKPGDIYVVGSSDKEFKALYSKHEGDASVYYEKVTSGPKSGEYIIVSEAVSAVYYTIDAWSASSYYTVASVTMSANGTVSGTNATSASAKTFTVHAGHNGTYANKFAIYDGAYYLQSGTSISRQDAQSYTWELLDGNTDVNSKGTPYPSAGSIHSTSSTTYDLELNSGSSPKRVNMYANTQKEVFLYRKKIAGTTYYATNPASCDIPDDIEVSYNDNKAHAGDQTITGMPSGTTLDFTSYPNFDSYTIGAAPTDPTGYHFAGWNTSADGNGDDYTAGASVTTFGYRETITLYAKWERVYSVTLYDNGVERTTLVEASAGAGVTLPSGNNCTPTSPFTFVGWTESAVELNADPVRPASETLHTAGSYSPTDDITLYSVYSRSVNGCEDFAAGVSGAYKLTNKGSSDYAIVTANANRYDKAASGTAEIFYIAYSEAKSAYTIRTSLGYLGWSGASGSENLTKNNTTPYYWDIKEGSSGNAGYWNFQPIGASTKQFSGNGTYFNLHSNSTKYYIQLTKNAMTYYYNTALCGDAKITFHDGGGSISGTPTTPTGASWNSTTHVLSGLEDCDKITTFPTASYDGWTFVGWSTEDYTNSGKHTEGTSQYAAENASTDEPDGSEIYKTGGNPYVVRGGSIDLYPIFTRFPENEPFNMETGGTYYMYYLDEGSDDGYGAPVRKYAGPWDGTKRYTAVSNCANATAFRFTKSGDVWHIQNVANDQYIGGKAADDWLVENASLGTLTDWTITIRSGNQFNATCQSGRQISVFENFFMDYSSDNLIVNPGYHCVYLGTCEERIFSSEPNPTPILELSGEPYVTSSNSQEIRATATMTVSAAHLTSVPADKVIVSGGTGLRFATEANATPSNTLSLSLTSGNLAATTIYVYYNPSATEDGLENIVVTAKAYNNTTDKKFQTTGTVHARHLPANFVIAAKWGDLWYALPNTCTSDGSSTTGVVITVDNDNDPTAATAAPSTAKWGLRKTKAGSRVDGSHNDRMVFTERATATANNQQALYNYNSADVYANATYENYNNTNPTRYEWIPVSSDFKDYTLTNASESKPLILRNDGDFKAQTTNQAYGGKVRLLPATFYTEAPMQVIEWKASSVLVMYTGSGVTATTKVGSAVEGSAQTLTAKKIDHGVFELTTGSLTSAANKQLIITIKNGSSAVVCRKAFVVPAIINTSGKTADYVVSGADDAEKIANAARTDVVILDGGVLSAVATKYTFKDITVYPGGKLVIGKTDKQLGMRSLTLRGGSSWGAASYEHKYPQFIVNNATDGAYSNTAVKINYDYVTTKAQYYTFVLPYTGNTSTIKYPVDIYGSAVAANNTGSFEFQCYNGSARAAGGSGWATLAEPADLVAGRGYTFLGMPKKVDAYNGTDDSHSTTRQTYGIHRIPMSVSAATVQSGETNSSPGKSTPISVTLADKNNASGWVLVGNPFMGDVTGLDNDDIQVGNLIHSDTNPWDGKWRWNPESSQRFVVIPGPDGTTYESEEVSTAELPAFKNFFVQIKSSSVTSLVIPASSRDDAALAPARFTAQEEKDIRLAVDLVSDTRSDKVDLLINDAYSAEFDEDADFTKMMNGTNLNLYGVYPGDNLSFIAVDKATAAGSIAIGYQVPAAGEYTLQLSDRAYVMADALEALYVTDHEVSPEITTDLLDGPYNFHVNNAETNNTRFTMSIRLAPKTPTDIEVVIPDELKDSGALKFIYQDKMYILRNGVIYDATGKKVREINR